MYMNPKQAAAALKMSRQWLYQLINKGELGTTEIAGRLVVIEDARFKAIQRERAKHSARKVP